MMNHAAIRARCTCEPGNPDSIRHDQGCPVREEPHGGEIKVDWPAVAVLLAVLLICAILFMLAEVHLITALSTD